MIQIRHNVFETNSSSSHALALSREADYNNHPDVVNFEQGDFGWADEEVSPADYLYTYILTVVMGNYEDDIPASDVFENPYIKDSLERITQDSISKINTFLLPTLKDCYRLKRDCKKTLQIVANYFYFLNYYQQGKLHFNYKDSLFDSNFFAELLNSTNAKECFAKYKPLFADLCDNQAFVNDLITVIDSSQI